MVTRNFRKIRIRFDKYPEIDYIITMKIIGTKSCYHTREFIKNRTGLVDYLNRYSGL